MLKKVQTKYFIFYGEGEYHSM